MLIRFFTVAVLAAALAACGDAAWSPYDGGGNDAGIPSYEVRFASTAPLTLGIETVAPIVVRVLTVTGDGQTVPIANATVTFGISGPSAGSSLVESEVTTDADGYATTRLVTGRQAANFYVRVTAPYANAVGMDVRVDPLAFGALGVTAAYAGTRMLGEVEVAVVAGGSCTSAETLDAAGNPAALWPAGTMSGTFPSVGAGGIYAVVVSARSPVGGYAAAGCSDGHVATQGTVTPIAVTLKDRVAFLREDLPGTFTIEASSIATWVASVGSDALIDYIQASGGSAQMLFDALEAELRYVNDTSSANAVAALATPGALAQLTTDLEFAGSGPVDVTGGITHGIELLAPTIALRGTLLFPSVADPSFSIESVLVGVGGDEIPDFNDAIGFDTLSVPLPGAFATEREAYHVAGAVIPFASDDVAQLLLNTLAETLGAPLPVHFGPSAGVLQLLSIPDVGQYCPTEACFKAVSSRIVVSLIDAALAAFVTESVARAELRLSGAIDLLDVNEDELVDTASTVDGLAAWSSATGTVATECTYSIAATVIASMP